MNKELTPIGQICTAIDAMQGGLSESLQGTGVSTKRFVATAKMAVQTHNDKDKLANADRQSLYLSIKKAAGDGLMPDNREAALVIYGKQVQYQPMVQGLVKLARNSGEIESIGAYIVYENDNFTYRVGVDAVPEHEANGQDGKGWFSSERGEPIGVWAYIKLKSGDYLEPVMLTKERIDRIATRSKMSGNYNPKTGKDWEEFWKKAAIRNILKYAPRSTALENAMNEMDSEFDFNEPSDVVEENPQEQKPEIKETKAAKAIKEKQEEDVIENEEPEIKDAEIVDDEEELPI